MLQIRSIIARLVHDFEWNVAHHAEPTFFVTLKPSKAALNVQRRTTFTGPDTRDP